MAEMQFTWIFCKTCKTAAVICPKCGNNCCNAGYGKVDGVICDVCPLAYQYQDLAYATGKVPTRKKLSSKRIISRIDLMKKRYRIQENGRWSIYEHENEVYVCSDDFTHDVLLRIQGDFRNREEKLTYARGIVKRLNTTRRRKKETQ
jgi:hypothetical protein